MIVFENTERSLKDIYLSINRICNFNLFSYSLFVIET